MILFIVNITASLLILAQSNKSVAKSIASKRAFNLKRLLINTWKTFAEDNGLTSKETCVFGGHVLRHFMATINMKNVQKHLDDTHDNWFPQDCFLGEEGDIDIFFKDPVDRRAFVKRLRHVFTMKDVTPSSHYQTDALPVDLIRLRLGSNLQEPDMPFVYIDLVCKTEEGRLLVPYCDVKNLQFGPEEEASVRRFEHSYLPRPAFLVKSPITSVIELSRTIHNIEQKRTQLHILSFVEFERLFPTMHREDYERYWRGVLGRGRQMIFRDNWSFSNLVDSEMCHCGNNEGWEDILCPQSDDCLEIVQGCSKCKHVCTIYKI